MGEQYLLFIALAIVVIFLVYSYVGDSIAGVKSVSADEAVRLFNKDAKIFDVRASTEFKSGYIGEAENLNANEIIKKLNNTDFTKEGDILLYCASGARSSNAARAVTKAGYSNVHNLSGGILAWQNAGLPINKPVSKKSKKRAKK